VMVPSPLYVNTSMIPSEPPSSILSKGRSRIACSITARSLISNSMTVLSSVPALIARKESKKGSPLGNLRMPAPAAGNLCSSTTAPHRSAMACMAMRRHT
jgi:hypothetical protein